MGKEGDEYKSESHIELVQIQIKSSYHKSYTFDEIYFQAIHRDLELAALINITPKFLMK